MRSTGLMGERSVAILPKAAPPGQVAKKIEHEVMTANSVDPLDNTFLQISKVATRIDRTVGIFETWFEQNESALSSTIQSADQLMTHASAVCAQVEEHNVVASLKETSMLLSDNLRSIKESLENDRLLQKIASLTSRAEQTVELLNTEGAETLSHLRQTTRDLAGGVGTLGRLIVSDDFYLRVNSLFSKAETLMNDVNHYGLLFQYDKHWQRARTRKANLLKALDTPREFRDYFEGEVDSITTSLGRLGELMDKASLEQDRLSQDETFKKQFSNLMRQVQSLSDNIQLYNANLHVGD
jgi:phospholipid/cholesterol/gamma-HCH transport system substrate-binding protein